MIENRFMKKVSLYISLALFFTFTSCTEYLDVKDKGQVIPETAEEFSALIHNHLRNIDRADDYVILGNYMTTLSYEGYSDNLDGDLNTTGRVPLYVGTDINIMTTRYGKLFLFDN